MIDPAWDKRLLDAFRKQGWSMTRRTPGKRLVKDEDGRYREVGEDGRRTPVDSE